MNDNIIVQGLGFEISEDKSNPDYLKGRFCICDFDTNKNGVALNRETIDEWVATLIGTPLVAKIAKNLRGKSDFGSHEMKVVSFKDKNGKVHKKAIFDTSAFGVCTDVSIETAEDGKDYIYANYKIWKRFENACKIIQERADSLKTSWEICTEEFTQKIKDNKITKIIDKGRFIGLAMLGSAIPPAYDSSGLLEVASEQEDELDTALIEDLQNLTISTDIKNSTDKEVNMDKDNVEVLENSTVQNNISDNIDENKEVDIIESAKETEEKELDKETEVSAEQDDGNDNKETSEATETSEKDDDDKETETDDENNKEKSEATEVSALTERDLRRNLERAFEQADENGCCTYGYIVFMFPADNMAWFRECGQKSELDLVEVKYTVENDNVTITEKNPVSLTVSPREINKVIASKDSAITEMSAQIKKLNDEISALQPYKDKVEEIEKAEKETKLKQDRKELSEYAISSGYITEEEIESSEEIQQLINDLDKSGIQSIISDRVVSALTNKDEVKVETSETKSDETNIKVNLSAVDSNAENGAKINAKDARKAIRNYIGRK